MFIRFKSCDVGKKEASTEICTFEGIRYDLLSGFAILSTEHREHDYLMQMDTVMYERFAEKLCAVMSEVMSKPGTMMEIGGSPLIRVKHGSLTRSGGAGNSYVIKSVQPKAPATLPS